MNIKAMKSTFETGGFRIIKPREDYPPTIALRSVQMFSKRPRRSESAASASTGLRLMPRIPNVLRTTLF